MVQTTIAGAIVAAAALWVMWRYAMPRTAKIALRRRTGRDTKSCGGDCGCS